MEAFSVWTVEPIRGLGDWFLTRTCVRALTFLKPSGLMNNSARVARSKVVVLKYVTRASIAWALLDELIDEALVFTLESTLGIWIVVRKRIVVFVILRIFVA